MGKYTNLKTKSIQNCKVAEYAKDNSYYDVAVSRYYYALLQLINYILYNRKTEFVVSNDGGSHRFTIDEFNKYIYRKCKKKLNDEDYPNLLVIDDLKRWRQQADYKDRLITEKEFSDDFMKKFNLCYNTIREKILCEEV